VSSRSWQDSAVQELFTENKREIVTYVIAHEVFRRTTKILASANIPVMPLKGVLLQLTVYDRPWEREISDIDLLVPEKYFEQSLDCLKQAGCFYVRDPTGAANVKWPDIELSVDLHECLFPRGLFRLPTDELFARARPDTHACGHEIWIANPLDTYAHLVGHFVKSRCDRRDAKYFQDIRALVDTHSLDSAACAQHLQRCGLARAARFFLSLDVAVTGNRFSFDVLRALESDRIGELLAKAAGAAIPTIPKHWFVGAIPVHMLNYSVAAGTASLCYRLVSVFQYHLKKPQL
jgi:hypothetical protein